MFRIEGDTFSAAGLAKIGFDLHGVLTEAPKVLKPILMALRKAGHEVYILSGPPEKVVRKELDSLGYYEGVHFDKVFSMIDLAMKLKAKVWEQPKGHYWCNDRLWWTLKGLICKEHNIQILIDDRPEYQIHLPEFTTFYRT